MPIIKGWSDPSTGASFGQACYVVGNVTTDTQRQGAQIQIAAYVGLAEYSAGDTPIEQKTINVTGSAYMSFFDGAERARAQQYLTGLLQFSGGTVV